MIECMHRHQQKPRKSFRWLREVIIRPQCWFGGTLPIFAYFCEKGVKTSANVYQQTVLNRIVEPLNQTMFQDRHWIFQQDSAPAHKARTTQTWPERHVPAFLSPDDWPSAAPSYASWITNYGRF